MPRHLVLCYMAAVVLLSLIFFSLHNQSVVACSPEVRVEQVYSRRDMCSVCLYIFIDTTASLYLKNIYICVCVCVCVNLKPMYGFEGSAELVPLVHY